jgi:hypothetical protein
MLTRDEILKADDLRRIDVEVPEWGGTIRLRVVTSKERHRFQTEIAKAKDGVPPDFMEKFLVACAVDDAGKPLFSDEDIAALRGKSAVVLTKLFNKAAELNGMTDAAIEEIEGES